MKFDTDRATLRDATTILKTFLGDRGRVTLPALAGVKITAREAGYLTLEATDLEVAVTLTVPADVSTPGAMLLPRRDLHALLAGKSDHQVTVAADDDGLRATVAGAGTATLRALEIEDFPLLPAADDRAPVDTLTEQDVATLARVATCGSTDEARPVLTGMALDGNQAAATDSYRLAVATLEGSVTPCGAANRDSGTPSANLVPARTIAKLAKLKSDGAAVVVRPEAGQVAFALCAYAGPKTARRQVGVTVASRTIEGAFPNYRALWPDSEAGSVTVLPSELTAALDAVKPVLDGRNVAARLESTDDGRIRVYGGSQERGDAEAYAPTVDADGEPLHVALNPAFLASALKATDDGGPVRIAHRDGLKPVVLTSGGPVSVLLMPMRVN